MDDALKAIRAARRRHSAGKAPTPTGTRTLTAEQRARLKLHSFAWTKELQISDEDFAASDLVYGSAMISGQLKSGEGGNPATITDEAAIAGAGALRAMAIFGLAPLDIDHFESELPENYTEKYGAKINDPYPPGFIVDAEAVRVSVPPTGRDAVSVEFLAIVPNRHVYKMIGKHAFKGCSVVDAIRSVSCPSCATDGGKVEKENKKHDEGECMCTYGGSAYIGNTLVLEAVPNSNGTWVDVFDRTVYDAISEKAGDGKSVDDADKKDVAATPRPNLRRAIARARKNALADPSTRRRHSDVDIEQYMTDGMWNDEKASVEAFLTERGVDESVIGDMAEYLFANPTALNQYQLQDLSVEDLAAWWQTIIATRIVEQRLHTLERRVAGLITLKPNAKALAVLNDAPFGLSEVNYGARPPEAQCVGCRWYTSYTDGDPAEGSAPAGRCTITSADVGGDNGCDAFAAFPGTSGAEPEPEPDEPEDEPDDEPPPDGGGGGDDPDAGDENDDEEMSADDPDGGGADDGGKPGKKKGKGGQREPVPATTPPPRPGGPRTFPAPKSTRGGARATAKSNSVIIEEHPHNAAVVQHQQIDSEIAVRRENLAAIEAQLARMPRHRAGRAVAELERRRAIAQRELENILAVKKKS